MTTRRRLAAIPAALMILGVSVATWGAQAQTFTVDCTKGQTISAALERGDERKPLTLLVSGTCSENVVVTQDDVTLRSLPGGATIVGSSASGAITFRSSRVLMEGLAVRGGNVGVAVTGGSSVEIAGCDIRNATLSGINVVGSQSVTVRNSTVQNNGNMGLRAQQSDVTVVDTRIEFNAQDGVQVARNSSVGVIGGVLAANGRYGATLMGGSEATLTDVLITGNGTNPGMSPIHKGGVSSTSASSLQITNSRIVDNPGRGVVATLGTALGMSGVTITGSAAEGLIVYLGATANVTGGTISGNAGNGVSLRVDSSAQIVGGTTILNNGAHGIEVSQASKLWLYGTTIAVGGNAWYGLYCDDGESSAADTALITLLPPNGAGGISCSGY